MKQQTLGFTQDLLRVNSQCSQFRVDTIYMLIQFRVDTNYMLIPFKIICEDIGKFYLSSPYLVNSALMAGVR